MAGHCFEEWQRCDGQVQCPDMTDERGCDCRQRMRAQGKLCDAYPDCPDMEDERGCGPCQEGQLRCAVQGELQCVARAHLCNGIYDCDGGEDEMYCSRMSLTQVTKEEDYLFRGFGYLNTKVEGHFAPVCVKNQSEYLNFRTYVCDEIVGQR